MTKEEFLKLTTIFEMSDEDFEKVNSAYMELPNMTKQEFCKLYTEDMPRLLGMIARESATFDAWPKETSTASTPLRPA